MIGFLLTIYIGISLLDLYYDFNIKEINGIMILIPMLLTYMFFIEQLHIGVIIMFVASLIEIYSYSSK